MKGQFTRLIIFLSVCVILIAGITAVTYAVWTTSDGSSTPATTGTGDWEDASFRYLVLEISYQDGSSESAVYRQKAEDGSDFSAFEVSKTDVSTATGVTVKGYKGILTTLKIPPSVTVKNADGQSALLPVTAIATGTVEQYDGLALIEKLEIPASVTKIEDYSFMFCKNLASVTFVQGEEALTLGDMCFYGCVKLSESAVDFGGRSVTQGENCFVNP